MRENDFENVSLEFGQEIFEWLINSSCEKKCKIILCRSKTLDFNYFTHLEKPHPHTTSQGG